MMHLKFANLPQLQQRVNRVSAISGSNHTYVSSSCLVFAVSKTIFHLRTEICRLLIKLFQDNNFCLKPNRKLAVSQKPNAMGHTSVPSISGLTWAVRAEEAEREHIGGPPSRLPISKARSSAGARERETLALSPESPASPPASAAAAAPDLRRLAPSLV